MSAGQHLNLEISAKLIFRDNVRIRDQIRPQILAPTGNSSASHNSPGIRQQTKKACQSHPALQPSVERSHLRQCYPHTRAALTRRFHQWGRGGESGKRHHGRAPPGARRDAGDPALQERMANDSTRCPSHAHLQRAEIHWRVKQAAYLFY